ncbi:hypothetical protein Ancab_011637 [Ancistrocladus abbreviatus]
MLMELGSAYKVFDGLPTTKLHCRVHNAELAGDHRAGTVGRGRGTGQKCTIIHPPSRAHPSVQTHQDQLLLSKLRPSRPMSRMK